MARVTLQTIADRLGVSRMTVSNAFSRPDQLSDDLRERILATAEELGYAGPHPAARALAKGSTGAVGVLLTDSLEYAFADEVATGFLGALVAGLAPTGLALTLLTTAGRDEDDNRIERSDVVPARDVAIDGALLYSCEVESEARTWLIRRKLPLVFVDQDPMPGISSVNIDDRGGARAAAQHVVDLGHRRVAIMDLRDDRLPGRSGRRGHPQEQRMRGWLEGLDDAGVRPQVVPTFTNSDEESSQVARALLAAEDRPTAVLCFSDVVALGVLQAARSLGLSVPDELSVVGFDDSPAARRSGLPLTTVHQDIAAKGQLGAEALIAAMEQARSGAMARVRHRMLPTELVVRQTTARPPLAAVQGSPVP
jgi:DNA-binding LacI/PurR family transcriptional regulator